jgi:hypothetical protein
VESLRRLATRNSAALERNKSRGRFGNSDRPLSTSEDKVRRSFRFKTIVSVFSTTMRREQRRYGHAKRLGTRTTLFDGNKPEKKLRRE